jgi:hypothetical protein
VPCADCPSDDTNAYHHQQQRATKRGRGQGQGELEVDGDPIHAASVHVNLGFGNVREDRGIQMTTGSFQNHSMEALECLVRVWLRENTHSFRRANIHKF